MAFTVVIWMRLVKNNIDRHLCFVLELLTYTTVGSPKPELSKFLELANFREFETSFL